jgi:uncharacterized protein YkwD
MFCSKCGKEVSSEERFCLRCGSYEKRQKPLKHGNDHTQGTPLINGNEWYYLVENKLRGPLSERSMKKYFIDGFINEKVLVRFGRDGYWLPARDVPKFEDLFKTPNNFKQSSLTKFGKYFLIGLVVCLCFFVVKATIHKKQTITITNNNELASLPQRQEKIVTNKNEVASSPPLQWGLTKNGIIAQTNKARQENGALPSLSENFLLNAIAEERLKDMFKNQYFSHYPPSGENFTELASRFGYAYSRLAENIASGVYRNDEKIVDGWMLSPGHRANILSSDVSEIGVAVGKGYLKGNETWISVQIFGHPPDHH